MKKFLCTTAILGLFSLSPGTPGYAQNSPAEGLKAGKTLVQARATRAENIHSVYLVTTACVPAVSEALEDARIRLGTPGDTVDVILQLSVRNTAGWFMNAPLIGRYLGGLATRAIYEAKLIGKDQHVLLSLHGEERAITGHEMCRDIGDDLADRLTQRREQD